MASSDYLQKYISYNSDKKKKRKSKKDNHGKGLKVFEEDAFLTVQSKVGLPDSEDDDVAEEIKEKMQLAEKMKFTTDGFQEVKSETAKKSPPLRRKRHDSSDNSPKRSERQGSEPSPPPRRRERHDSGEDLRRGKKLYDLSRRREKQRHDSDESPPRRSQRSLSPAKGRHGLEHERNFDRSSVRRKQHSPSPPTQSKRHDSDNSPPRRYDSDQSPPRRNHQSPSPPSRRRQRHDSDESLPRRRRGSDQSPVRRNQRSPSPSKFNNHDSNRRRSRHDSDQRKNQRSSSPQKTLEGKKAGLVSAAEMREETIKLKEDERKKMLNLDEELSGRYAETKHRSSYIKRGKRINKEDEEKKEREQQKTEELKTKYEMWNRGVVQLQKRQDQLKDEERTMAEGFARYADDESLNKHLKEQILEDDPMAELISKKRTKINIRKGLVYPSYQGQWPPNRFNIPPGYRWDGVDRSNGFESRLQLMANKRKAEDNAAYRAITECQE